MTRRTGLVVTGTVALLAVALGVAAAYELRHGRRVRAGLATNHPQGFDFGAPPCGPAQRPAAGPDDVLIRSLGVAGLWIEWRGDAVMTAPFFSRYGLLRSIAGSIAPDRQAIDAGLAGLPLEQAGAVLVGHSHFDHLGDVPITALEHATRARILVNASGARMLAPFQRLTPRVDALDPASPDWIRVRDATDRALPFRVLPVPSEHAPHWHGIHYARGTVDEPWTSWDGRPLRAMLEGRTFAFLIDVLREDGSVAFRIYYQDAAAPAPYGLPPTEALAERPIDLAVLCMPGHWLAAGYPAALLDRTRPRHVLALHYEDFFRPRDRPLRFVASLTDDRAAAMLELVAARHDAAAGPAVAPDPPACGPSAPAWTMPLPGEWLRFRSDPRSPRSRPRPGPA